MWLFDVLYPSALDAQHRISSLTLHMLAWPQNRGHHSTTALIIHNTLTLKYSSASTFCFFFISFFLMLIITGMGTSGRGVGALCIVRQDCT